jgi:hypothetical protein
MRPRFEGFSVLLIYDFFFSSFLPSVGCPFDLLNSAPDRDPFDCKVRNFSERYGMGYKKKKVTS